MATRRKRLILWSAIVSTGLLLSLAYAFERMTEAPMFVPGSVAERIAARGETLQPQASDPAPDRWQVTHDVTLHRVSLGSGPPVLFVHGGPGFPPLQPPAALTSLARDHTVHVYHQRGCGHSTRPLHAAPAGSFYAKLKAVEDQLGLAEQLADIERIRRRLGADQLRLVGHSFGGLIAALYAAEFPARVSHLLLVAPAPLVVMPKPGPDLFALTRERLPGSERKAYDDYLARYFDFGWALDRDDETLGRFYAEFQTFHARATGTAVQPQPSAAGGFLVLATYASLGQRHDYRPAFARITAHTLVLHGARDLSPEADSRAVAEAIPGAQHERVSAGHFILEEAPEAVAAALAKLESMAALSAR